MVPQPKPSYFASPDDAELEWLLCLAAAIQTREQPQRTFEPECKPLPPQSFRTKLQSILKGLRGSERFRAA